MNQSFNESFNQSFNRHSLFLTTFLTSLLSFDIESSYHPTQGLQRSEVVAAVARMPMTSTLTGHGLYKLGSIKDRITTDPQSRRISHATIQLNEVVRFFDLPLLETASIRMGSIHRKSSPPPVRVFSRTFPHYSLMDGVTAHHWRQFWMKESSLFSQQIPTIQMCKIVDLENRCFRLQIITESKPGLS